MPSDPTALESGRCASIVSGVLEFSDDVGYLRGQPGDRVRVVSTRRPGSAGFPARTSGAGGFLGLRTPSALTPKRSADIRTRICRYSIRAIARGVGVILKKLGL